MPAELLRTESSAAAREQGGTIVYHPRYERFLHRCGVSTAATALALTGEIVCGHPDRHVIRVELRTDTVRRTVFVKREHSVAFRTRFRNARAGFGWVSRSEREARTLQALETAGLPGPQWMAYGEDESGQAFLVVDELKGCHDLPTVLTDRATPRDDLARRIGLSVSELHSAGFSTPEFSAKHVFIHPVSLDVTLIDWQSAPPRGSVSLSERVRALAGLNASLRPEHASDRERFRFAHRYLKVWQRSASPKDVPPRFGTLVRAVLKETERIESRSSKRDQKLRPAPTLRWLRGESVCVSPAIEHLWPEPADGPPFYLTEPAGRTAEEEWVTLADGRRALLVRFYTCDLPGRLAAAIRERSWRSPAAIGARILFHLFRHGVPAPTLLAFGQRRLSAVSAASFILFALESQIMSLREVLSESSSPRQLLYECGRLLRALHEAGCRPTFKARHTMVVARASGTVWIDSPFSVRLARRIAPSDRRADLEKLIRKEFPRLGRTDRLRIAKGYDGATATPEGGEQLFSFFPLEAPAR